MVIQHNLSAMNAHRHLGINNSQNSKNLEKLSSGYKVNRAGDDAAGLAISEKMRGQIRGLDMAGRNAQNGVSLIQTAEGALNETHSILQRMRELAVQSSNGTYQEEVDRENLDKEFQALKSEIDRIAQSTHYNNIKLLDGTLGGKTVTQLGAAETTATLTKLGLQGKTITLLGDYATQYDGADAYFLVRENGLNPLGLQAFSLSLQIGDKTYSLDTDNRTFIDPSNPDAAGEPSEVAILNTGYSGRLGELAGIISTGVVNLALESGAVSLADVVKDAMIATPESKLIFQIGANGSADQRVGLHVDNMSSGNLGAKKYTDSTGKEYGGYVTDADISTREMANDAIYVLDGAINQVSGTRADLGALQNRLEHTINNLGVARENLQSAESSIRDVDMAKEMMEFTKNNILTQASQSMLAQANQLPQGVLQLLQ